MLRLPQEIGPVEPLTKTAYHLGGAGEVDRTGPVVRTLGHHIRSEQEEQSALGVSPHTGART